MKIVKRILVAVGIATALVAIPIQSAGAYWLGPAPGLGPWGHSYVYDPIYRFGPPQCGAIFASSTSTVRPTRAGVSNADTATVGGGSSI